VRSCHLETEPALQDKAVEQDAARGTALVRVVLAVLAVAAWDSVVADVVVVAALAVASA
jgi:hypothetical protein